MYTRSLLAFTGAQTKEAPPAAHALCMVAKQGSGQRTSEMNPGEMAALAVELFPRVTQRLVESPQVLGALSVGIDSALTQKFEDRMKTAGDKAGSAFASLEERINKHTAMANNALKRLETGASKIAQQRDAAQKANRERNNRIDDMCTELNSDSASTKQDSRAYAARVQQDAEKSNVEL